MRHVLPSALLLAAVALAAPAAAGSPAAGRQRGLEPVHQPIVTGDRAYVPGCPDWSDADHVPSEAQGSNFGCATASNLAAMIADPNDLLHGRRETGPDAETATKAIKAWRAAVPSGAGGQVERVSAKGNQ